MTILSAADKALLREPEQYTNLYLSIFQPNVAFKARVNDAGIAAGEMEIDYDNVTEGSWTDVKIGSTLLVGSSNGARDVGKVRIKSITASTITVAENTDIQWENNQFLTVLDYFDVWAVYPRIIQDPNDPTKVIFYKDYDKAIVTGKQ